MSRQNIASIAYAVAAVVALVVGLLIDSGLLILFAVLVALVGVVHVMLLRQGQGPVTIKDQHDRAESIARHGNVPPERPRGM